MKFKRYKGLVISGSILVTIWVLSAWKLSAEPKFTQVSISGIIYTTATNNNPTATGYDAVPGVEVVIEGTDRKVVSDKRGMFNFEDLKAGTYTLVATKEGYKTVRKTVQVKGTAFPTLVKMLMNPVGSVVIGETPAGPGTVYVAFAARKSSQRKGASQGFPLKTQQLFRGAVAAGADPLAIAGNAPDSIRNPQDYNWNPITSAPNTLMIFPPQAPTRTGFHELQVSPYWLCFNSDGTVLYVSNAASQIQVFDARTNTLLRNLPVPGFVTDLRLSPRGDYVLASVLAAAPGVMLIDTSTNEPAAFLPTPQLLSGGPGQPRAAVMDLDSKRVLAVIGDATNGEVVALDVLTGQVAGRVTVGPNPTGAALSPDGRVLYVVDSASADVSVVDAWTLTLMGRVRVGVNPQKVFVTCKDAGTVVRINTKTDVAEHTTVPLPNSSPFGVAVKP